MTELRILLAVAGVVVLGLVYWISRRSPPPPRAPQDPFAQPLGEVDLPGIRIDDEAPPAPDPGRQLILSLHILPVAGASFTTAAVREALEGAGLTFGDMDIFHRTDAASARTVFSVANAFEPGSFPADSPAETPIRGLALFMLLPGPRRGVEAFADMLATGRRVARELGGNLLDEKRGTLTRQTARHIRERIIEFEYGLNH